MSDEELLAFNAQGFVPGPDESSEEFEERVTLAKKRESQPHSEWIRQHLKELFDFEPNSLPVVYSNQKLAPWQGAACWIGEDGGVSVQLREGFRKGRYLGHSREEIVAHEAAHAARAAFEEPENEEYFSYATSDKRWRKVLGPILQKPWEAWAFIGFCIAGIITPFAMVLSIALLGWGFWRLIQGHRRLSKASLLLYGEIKDYKKVRAILFRLTDREIRQLSRGQWIQGDNSLRWRLLKLAYLN